MSYATREDFFAAKKRRFKDVTLWNGFKARIRSLNAQEFAEIDAKNIDFKKGGLSASGVKSSNIRLIVAGVCDGEGNPLFTEADMDALSQVDSAMIEPLVRELKEHCGLRAEGDPLKNCEGTGDGGSPCTVAEPSPAGSTD